MNLIKNIFLFFFILFITSCADYKSSDVSKEIEKKYYSSKGFALIYEDSLYKEKIINKKMDNSKIIAIHSSLKRNTPVRIINPENSNFIETKIIKNANFPKIFNLAISKEIANILELDPENPYIEFYEYKKNKTFIAKEGSIFEEEKNVAIKVPVDEIKIDELTVEKKKVEKKITKNNKYTIIISDFYYEESAHNLKKHLVAETKIDKFAVKKINNETYRLMLGPFENFNALKSSYISLNNLGFEELNIYRE